MDDPTSGHDARAAAVVMRTVRNTVDTGRTVVCTIHQPSMDIFEAFDELFLMERGGREIYAGPLGRHSFHLIEYFEVAIEIPNVLVQALIYGLIVYVMNGFEKTATKILWVGRRWGRTWKSDGTQAAKVSLYSASWLTVENVLVLVRGGSLRESAIYHELMRLFRPARECFAAKMLKEHKGILCHK